MTESSEVCAAFCGVWSWLPPVFSLLADVGTLLVGLTAIFTVAFAAKQLNAWRIQNLLQRRSVIAEHALIAVAEVDFALRDIRNRLESIPKTDSIEKNATLKIKYEKIFSNNEVFRSLRDSQISLQTLIENDELNSSFDELFNIRADIVHALEFMRDSEDEDDPEYRQLRVKWRRTIYGSYGRDDPVGNRQQTAVSSIKKILKPIVKLQHI